MIVRSYKPDDYNEVAGLYKQSQLYGGKFDESRDSAERLRVRIKADPDAILVAETDGNIVGTLSLIDDRRVAWLFRFAVREGDQEIQIAKALYAKAIAALKTKGHTQVLVYAPAGDDKLDSRYEELGLNKGNDYTCYWKDI